MIPMDMTPEKAEFMARCLVSGSEKHSKSGKIEPISGAWSGRFRTHPWVEQADDEGWARELRSACVAGAKQRILAGVKPNDILAEHVMPRRDIVERWRREAQRAREAAEWREANPSHAALRGLAPIDVAGLVRRAWHDGVDPETGEIT